MAKHSDMVTATARHYMYSKISFFQGWKEKVYPVSTPQRPPPFRRWLEKRKSLPNQLDFVNYVINSHSFLLLQKAIYISNGVSVREKWIPLEPSLRRNLFWGLPCNFLTGKTPPQSLPLHRVVSCVIVIEVEWVAGHGVDTVAVEERWSTNKHLGFASCCCLVHRLGIFITAVWKTGRIRFLRESQSYYWVL